MIGNNIGNQQLRYHHLRSLPVILDIRQKKLGRAGSSDILQPVALTRAV